MQEDVPSWLFGIGQYWSFWCPAYFQTAGKTPNTFCRGGSATHAAAAELPWITAWYSKDSWNWSHFTVVSCVANGGNSCSTACEAAAGASYLGCGLPAEEVVLLLPQLPSAAACRCHSCGREKSDCYSRALTHQNCRNHFPDEWANIPYPTKGSCLINRGLWFNSCESEPGLPLLLAGLCWPQVSRLCWYKMNGYCTRGLQSASANVT